MPETESINIQNEKAEVSGGLVGQVPNDLDSEVQPRDENGIKVYVRGFRLGTLTTTLCLSMLLSVLETTIVSTSLVSITNALDGFDKRGWVVTSYLLTYTGFFVIFAHISDVFGQKASMIAAVFVFTAFSAACGGSQSITQLIVFRAFQGIGGSGIYSMVLAIVPNLVPPKKYPTYLAIVSSVFAFASFLGPTFGGLINDYTTWRWVFLINVPVGVVALIALGITIPKHFPYKDSQKSPQQERRFLTRSLTEMDFLGTTFLLAGSVLLVAALEQTGIDQSWNSPVTVTFLVSSGVFWLLLLVWERYRGQIKTEQRSVFPWRLVQNRLFMGLLLNSFLTGFPFMNAVINLPQRFQDVDGNSPLGAGYRMIALMLCTPVASVLSSFLTSRKVPPLYILVFSAIIQLIGVTFMSLISTAEQSIRPAEYGLEILMGFGFGFNFNILLLMASTVVDKKDIGLALGAITQIRVLGGAIGLAIGTTILNSRIKSDLSRILSPDQLHSLFQSTSIILSFPTAIQHTVRSVYAAGYNKQMQIMIWFCVAEFLSLSLLVEKKLRRKA